MLPRTIRCDDCGATRTGRLNRDRVTEPVRVECPDCGSTAFVDVVDERDRRGRNGRRDSHDRRD